MILSPNSGWLTPTRLIGLSAYLFSAISCGIVWGRKHQTPPSSRLAALLTVLNTILFLDMACDGRWRLHDLLEHAAIERSLYGQRHGWQIVALATLGGVLLVALGTALLRVWGRPGERLAVCGALISLSCWFVEVVSLHAVDAVLYRTVAGVKLVSIFWIACSLMTCLGILWDMGRSQSIQRKV